jgi:hypothetical protein
LEAPSGNLSGRWDADIEFFSSKSKHGFFFEQDGNWIQGTHKGEFTVRDIRGTVEGNSVRLRSVDRHPADSITFIFTGTLAGDTITGSIYMGEYRTANFVATRSTNKAPREKITVPGGPPLAT